MWVCGAPIGNVKAIAYIQLSLSQSSASWVDVVDAAAKDYAVEIAEEICALLQASTEVLPEVGINAVKFMLRWRAHIKREIVKELYQLLREKECSEAMELLEDAIGVEVLQEQ
jgi:hypothetical protein